MVKLKMKIEDIQEKQKIPADLLSPCQSSYKLERRCCQATCTGMEGEKKVQHLAENGEVGYQDTIWKGIKVSQGTVTM